MHPRAGLNFPQVQHLDVDEFYLDEALASTDFGSETRKGGVVKFNSSASANNGWVWGSNATDTPIATNHRLCGPGGSGNLLRSRGSCDIVVRFGVWKRQWKWQRLW